MSEATEERRLWSVTSIIGEGVSKGEALTGWAVKASAEWTLDNIDAVRSLVENGQREAALDTIKGARFRASREAKMRGSAIHRVAEAINLGVVPPEYDPRLEPQIGHYRRWLEDFAPVLELAEAPIYNLRYAYAGTLDSIATIHGSKLVLDVKTTTKRTDHDGMLPPYPEVALQLAAYRNAELIGLQPPTQRNYNNRRYYIYSPEIQKAEMPEVDGAAVLVLFADDYRFVPVRTDQPVFDAFLYAREMLRWKMDLSQRVLGMPLDPLPKGAA